ncbi:MAG: ABC transporter permease DevC [Isosphaeraceae bacterium]
MIADTSAANTRGGGRRRARPGRVIPLAWRNLTESKVKLAASVAGAAFAVVLMLVENGFRNALLDNMVAVVLSLDGDLFMTNRGRYMVSQPVPFPRQRLELAKEVPGVAEAHPFYLLTGEDSLWRNPLNGLSRPIRLLAYDPRADLLALDAVHRQRAAWSRPDTVLADDRSKLRSFGKLSPGTVSEFNGRQVKVVGEFSMGTDFRSNGTILMSEANLFRYCALRAAVPWALTPVDLGVLRLRPGTPRNEARAAVAARLPADVIVLTKAELVRKEQDFWEKVTPIGVVFDIGVAMGFVVGLAICYQVLFAEIADRLPQFATLKAIGHTDGALARIVLLEALFLALLGFAAGLAISVWLFRWIQDETGLTMVLRVPDALGVLALTVLMCGAAGLLASRRLLTVDPASLFA